LLSDAGLTPDVVGPSSTFVFLWAAGFDVFFVVGFLGLSIGFSDDNPLSFDGKLARDDVVLVVVIFGGDDAFLFEVDVEGETIFDLRYYYIKDYVAYKLL